jgi:hypothetical protein
MTAKPYNWLHPNGKDHYEQLFGDVGPFIDAVLAIVFLASVLLPVLVLQWLALRIAV